MSFCPKVEPVWQDLISGKKNIEFEFLAAKILLGTLTRNFRKNPQPEKLEQCALELRELFLQNTDLPSARNDLKKVLG